MIHVALARRFVHLSARSDPIAARKLLGADKLIGVSIHTVTEAEAIDPAVVDYAIAGPVFETASKPGYGPEIGRKGLADITAVARVPIFAIGGINAMRAAEVLAAGPAGIAVMGGVMRAVDPPQEMKALLVTITGAPRCLLTVPIKHLYCASQQVRALDFRNGSKADHDALNSRSPLYPPKADIAGRQLNVRFVPKADINRLIRSSRRRARAGSPAT